MMFKNSKGADCSRVVTKEWQRKKSNTRQDIAIGIFSENKIKFPWLESNCIRVLHFLFIRKPILEILTFKNKLNCLEQAIKKRSLYASN